MSVSITQVTASGNLPTGYNLVMINAQSGNLNCTMADINIVGYGATYVLKRIDSTLNTVTISGINAHQTIDLLPSISLAAGQYTKIVSYQGTWKTIALGSGNSSNFYGNNSLVVPWKAQADSNHPYVSSAKCYYYIGNGFQQDQEATSSGINADSIYGNGIHPFFVPNVVTVQWVMSGVNSATQSGSTFNLRIYYSNPASGLGTNLVSPQNVSCTQLNCASSSLPQSGTITIPFTAFSSMSYLPNVNAAWTIVVDTSTPLSTAKNFSIGGTIMFAP